MKKQCKDTDPSSEKFKKYVWESNRIYQRMCRVRRNEVLAQLTFQKCQFPFLFSYTEELHQEQQSAFPNLLWKTGNQPQQYSEWREINRLRDRLNLLSFEISAAKLLYKNNPLKTKEEVNELYEKKVKDHKVNKGKASHPLLQSLIAPLQSLKFLDKVVPFTQ